MTFDPEGWRVFVAFLSFVLGIVTGYAIAKIK